MKMCPRTGRLGPVRGVLCLARLQRLKYARACHLRGFARLYACRDGIVCGIDETLQSRGAGRHSRSPWKGRTG
jgi:hypothetical protein